MKALIVGAIEKVARFKETKVHMISHFCLIEQSSAH